MTKERILNAIEVINFAIKNGISVREASVKSGYANTYVKNVKRAVNQAYDNNTISDDDYNLFMDAYEKYESSQRLETESEPSKDEVVEGEKLNVSQDGDVMNIEWRGKNDSFTDEGLPEEEPDEEGVFSLSSDAPQHGGYPDGHIKTLDELLRATQVDLNEWRVGRFIVNKWDVTSWQLGYAQTWENFQVKATLERIQEVKVAKNIADIFKEQIAGYKPPVVTANIQPAPQNGYTENNLLEISLFDLHIGKLAWAGETHENYDVKIACDRFNDAINSLLERAEGFHYNRILFPLGNDFFNSDNLHNTTTAGTPQDEDLRWRKTIEIAQDLVVNGINLLKAKGVPIDVVMIPGNHDFERNFHLGMYLKAWFRDDPQVNINNGGETRKYYNWGEVLLGFTHGNEEKEAALPLLMANEQKKAWGDSTFREWHLGHFHKKRSVKYTVFDKAQVLNEELGVTVRYLSSLSGTEQWHFKKGYIGSQKAGEAFIWNDQEGQIGHLNFNFTNFDRER